MRTRRHKLQVSTFPFLAVLLCAMGALLLVLLVMDRRAHYAARARAAEAARRAADETATAAEAQRSAAEERRAEAHAARQQERDAVHGRLVGQEAEVQQQIQAVRDELARAAERLQAELDDEAALKQQIDAEHALAADEQQAIVRVRAEEAKAVAQSEASRQAREQMTANLARLEQKLADLKAAHEKEQKTYSLVPYNGKHGDNRRPIYVECAVGRVIFYPDWTPLDEPLNAAALQAEVDRRTARQKEKMPVAQAASYTPYLLLLVRPDGISTYYRLRDALKSSKIDFGYEFVDKDWVLDFPADDQDAPPPAWTTAAKPAAADDAPPPPPGGAASRLHGVAPGGDAEGRPGGSGLGDGPPGPPGPPGSALFPRKGTGTATAMGGGPFAGPGGNGHGGSAVALNGPPLLGPPDVGAGPALTGPDGSPAGPSAGGPRGPNAGPPLTNPDGSPRPGAAVGGPMKGTGAGGPPGAATPTDARVIASDGPTAATGVPLPPLGVGQAPGAPRGAPPSPGQGPGAPTAAPPSGPGQGPASAGTGRGAGNAASLATTPGQGPASAGTGRGAGNAASLATTAGGGPPSAFASSRPTPAGSTGPASTGSGAPTDPSSTPPVPGPNQGTASASGPTDGTKPPTGPPGAAGQPAGGGAKASPGAAGRAAGGDGAATGDGSGYEPFLKAPPVPLLPSKKRPPLALQPARLSGDRDWVVYVECKAEGVVIYPTQLLVPTAALNRPSGSNPLLRTIQQMIDRKQSLVRPGEMPYRPEVRFLVRPDAERTYHLAYPTLDALAAPKTSQKLGPDDDISAVVAGH